LSGEECPSNSKSTKLQGQEEKNVKLSLHFDDVFLEIIDLTQKCKICHFAAITSSPQISKISSKGLRSAEEKIPE
jgi:uncharacterized protein (DUF2225 family)